MQCNNWTTAREGAVRVRVGGEGRRRVNASKKAHKITQKHCRKAHETTHIKRTRTPRAYAHTQDARSVARYKKNASNCPEQGGEILIDSAAEADNVCSAPDHDGPV